MSTDSVEYCYSWDDERFDSGTFSSIEEAIADAVATDEQRDFVYIGEAVPFKNSAFYPDACWVLEHMGEQAWGEVGDYSEDYPDVSKEAREDLNKQLSAMLDAWCEKHGVVPHFYRVQHSNRYPMPTNTELVKSLNAYSCITDERQRQQNDEGWSASHDDQHGADVLEAAARSYRDASGSESECPSYWPWSLEWWKPKNRERNLERAGALFIAASEVAERAGDYAKRDQLIGQVNCCVILLDSILSSQSIAK